MIKITTYILIIFYLTSFFCCKPLCKESRGIEGASLVVTFYNTANNEYFYPESTLAYPSPYVLDSLRVRDSKGNYLTTPNQLNSDPINPLKGFYVVSLYPIFIPSNDQAAFDSEQNKLIYIKYNATVSDTLKLIYKVSKGNCSSNKYDYLKVYYKNNLISEGSNIYYEGLQFKINH